MNLYPLRWVHSLLQWNSVLITEQEGDGGKLRRHRYRDSRDGDRPVIHNKLLILRLERKTARECLIMWTAATREDLGAATRRLSEVDGAGREAARPFPLFFLFNGINPRSLLLSPRRPGLTPEAPTSILQEPYPSSSIQTFIRALLQHFDLPTRIYQPLKALWFTLIIYWPDKSSAGSRRRSWRWHKSVKKKTTSLDFSFFLVVTGDGRWSSSSRIKQRFNLITSFDTVECFCLSLLFFYEACYREVFNYSVTDTRRYFKLRLETVSWGNKDVWR